MIRFLPLSVSTEEPGEQYLGPGEVYFFFDCVREEAMCSFESMNAVHVQGTEAVGAGALARWLWNNWRDVVETIMADKWDMVGMEDGDWRRVHVRIQAWRVT